MEAGLIGEPLSAALAFRPTHSQAQPQPSNSAGAAQAEPGPAPLLCSLWGAAAWPGLQHWHEHRFAVDMEKGHVALAETPQGYIQGPVI